MNTEHELIQKASLGCIESFRSLMILHRTYVRGVINQFIHNQSDMDDIEQDVWIRMFLNINKIAPTTNNTIKHWLAACAANRCRDLLRTKVRIHIDIEDVELMANVRHPVDALYRATITSELWNAIQQLPERQKEVIIREYWGGQSTLQIADSMATTVASVESLIKRARIKLRHTFRKASFREYAEIMD